MRSGFRVELQYVELSEELRRRNRAVAVENWILMLAPRDSGAHRQELANRYLRPVRGVLRYVADTRLVDVDLSGLIEHEYRDRGDRFRYGGESHGRLRRKRNTSLEIGPPIGHRHGDPAHVSDRNGNARIHRRVDRVPDESRRMCG